MHLFVDIKKHKTPRKTPSGLSGLQSNYSCMGVLGPCPSLSCKVAPIKMLPSRWEALCGLGLLGGRAQLKLFWVILIVLQWNISIHKYEWVSSRLVTTLFTACEDSLKRMTRKFYNFHNIIFNIVSVRSNVWEMPPRMTLNIDVWVYLRKRKQILSLSAVFLMISHNVPPWRKCHGLCTPCHDEDSPSFTVAKIML